MSEYYNMGYDAYWSGEELGDNPYDSIDQSYAHIQWDMGWTEAMDEEDDDARNSF